MAYVPHPPEPELLCLECADAREAEIPTVLEWGRFKNGLCEAWWDDKTVFTPRYLLLRDHRA